MQARLSIGELARRSGVAVSAIRFYEDRGLIASTRNGANHREFERVTLRRIAIIRAAQNVGLTLNQIAAALGALPKLRTPNTGDWVALSRAWQVALDDRIADLLMLRDQLSDCIGCGCVSLDSCGLVNAQDRLGASGAGALRLGAQQITSSSPAG